MGRYKRLSINELKSIKTILEIGKSLGLEQKILDFLIQDSLNLLVTPGDLISLVQIDGSFDEEKFKLYKQIIENNNSISAGIHTVALDMNTRDLASKFALYNLVIDDYIVKSDNPASKEIIKTQKNNILLGIVDDRIPKVGRIINFDGKNEDYKVYNINKNKYIFEPQEVNKEIRKVVELNTKYRYYYFDIESENIYMINKKNTYQEDYEDTFKYYDEKIKEFENKIIENKEALDMLHDTYEKYVISNQEVYKKLYKKHF